MDKIDKNRSNWQKSQKLQKLSKIDKIDKKIDKIDKNWQKSIKCTKGDQIEEKIYKNRQNCHKWQFTWALGSNLSPVTKSTGKWILTPFLAAFSINLGTILAPFSSYSEVPMDMPSKTLRKVKAMPPPMIISSTLSNMFSINWILSATLAPPKMAKNGCSGLSKAYENIDIIDKIDKIDII